MNRRGFIAAILAAPLAAWGIFAGNHLKPIKWIIKEPMVVYMNPGWVCRLEMPLRDTVQKRITWDENAPYCSDWKKFSDFVAEMKG